MRRRWTVAALAAGLALTAGACGVQPTGVNVASASPFQASRGPGPSAPSSLANLPYKVTLVLNPTTAGLARQITRYVAKQPESVFDLLPQLLDTNVTPYETEIGLTSNVQPDFTLAPTDSAHEYEIVGNRPSPSALIQMTCTFDAWWREHRDGRLASTRFRYEGEVITTWDDCASILGPDDSPSASPGPGKATKPVAPPSATAHGN